MPPPEFVAQLVGGRDPWDGARRIIHGEEGPVEFYWVYFEDPQEDGAGDGPYFGGEVEVRYLQLIDD